MNIGTEFGDVFDMPKIQNNIIKVIGVGGGGGNAVNYMFKQGIKGVDYVICNTDAQALEKSPIQNKIQLGISLTEGLGAGADPEIGEKSAMESISEIEAMLGNNTKMVFITAGMGGGTGTGAAPIIAKICKEKGILTVAIVTSPFKFEGQPRFEQAQRGIEKIRQHVDSLIVVNNNKLREIYGNLSLKTCYVKVDEVLTIAAKGIAEVITNHFDVNIDLRDAKTVLSNSGTAIMGSARTKGEGRALKAIMGALDSPLLNDNKITGAKNVLLLIVYGKDEITMDETDEINEYIQKEAGGNYQTNIIMGVGEDPSLEDEIMVTVIATGFNSDLQHEIIDLEQKKVVYTLDEDQFLQKELEVKSSFTDISFNNFVKQQAQNETIVYSLEEELQEDTLVMAPTSVKTENVLTKRAVSHTVSAQETPVVQPQMQTYELQIKDNPFYHLPVEFEVISYQEEEKKMEGDFVIYEKKSKPQKSTPVQPKIEPVQDEIIIVDLFTEPVSEQEKNKVLDTDTTAKDDGFVYFELEEYEQVEEALTKASVPVHTEKKKSVVEPIQMEILEKSAVENFKKKEENRTQPINNVHLVNLKESAENRRKTFKSFNHTFNQSAKILRDMEDIPAYKRQGIQIGHTHPEEMMSNLTLSMDSNNSMQIRRNNSFLHDNVD